jgi:uncharacterized oxidoreductase
LVYCASKAVWAASPWRCGAQLAETDVRVLEVLPPVVDTRMQAANRRRKMPASD